MLRHIGLFLFIIVFSPLIHAAECLDVFPNSPVPHPLLPFDKRFIDVPAFTGADGFLNNPETLNLGDGQYLSNESQQNIFVSTIPVTETSSRLYLANGGSWVNAQINVGGDPSKLIIVVAGSLAISGNDSKINAIIYATGAISISGDPTDPNDPNSPGGIEINGAVAAEGNISTNNRVTINYDANAIENADFNGMCDNTPVVLLADYHFDECSYTGAVGEVIDQTGNFSGQAFSNVNTALAGQVERFANLSNRSHHIETSILLPDSYSISTWFKKPTSSSNSPYFVLGAMNGGGDLMYIDRTNNWRWGVYNLSGASNGSYSFANLDDNWHHLTLVYDEGENETKLYIDSILVDTINRVVTGTLKYIGTSFDGVSGNNGQGFRAPLDEFMVFDGPLTSAGISEIYTNQLNKFNYDGSDRDPADCPALLGLYRFEQNSLSGQIDDTSGNDNHGSNLGGQSIAEGKYCRGFDSNGANSGSQTDNAFSSNLNLINDVGDIGTISFWFNSNTNWNQGGYNGGERTLFDATLNLGLGTNNKYFSLNIMNNGLLRFSFEDSVDGDYYIQEPSGSIRDGNKWYFVTATWNFTTNVFELYVDGNLRTRQTKNTSGALKDLGPIIFGDNASTYAANNHWVLPSSYSANGKFDEVRIYNTVLPESDIENDMNESFGCLVFDHFQIDTIDGEGLTCQADNIIIKACADSACSSLNADPFNVDLFVNGIKNRSLTVVGGSTATNYAHITEGNVALSLDQTYKCKDSINTPCNVNFKDSGFIFGNDDSDLLAFPTQLSGKPSDTGFRKKKIFLQALAKNETTGACEGVFPEGDLVPVNLSYSCVTGICTNDMLLSDYSSLVPVNSTPTKQLLKFEADSKVTLFIAYPDAGKLSLTAQKFIEIEDDEGNKVIKDFNGTSNDFVVRPFAFKLYFDPLKESNAVNAFAQDASGNADANQDPINYPAFKKAGEEFILSASAVQWKDTNPSQDVDEDGIPDDFTAISGNELAEHFNDQKISVNRRLVLPVGMNISFGLLTLKTSNKFSNSTVDNTYTFSEVGIIELSALLPGGNYLGAGTDGNIQGQVTNVGRFTPDHFELVLKKDGTLSSECNGAISTMPFVYSGQMSSLTSNKGAIKYLQQPELSIIPKRPICSNGNCTTENYQGDFVKLRLSGIQRYQVTVAGSLVDFPTTDAIQLGVDNMNKVRLTASYQNGDLNADVAPNLSHQVFKYNVDDHFSYAHEENSEVGPFSAKIKLSIASIIDEDNIKAIDIDGDPDGLGPISDSDTVVTFSPLGQEIRFGRAVLDNSFGPETSNLPQPLHIEYLDLLGNYVASVNDTCTIWDSSKVDLTTITLDKDATQSMGGSGPLVDGSSRYINLEAPDERGKVGVEYIVAPWLQYDWNANTIFTDNPTAIATFGMFRGNDRIIYQREILK
jgi:MSHA biogenesis protein MshQ